MDCNMVALAVTFLVGVVIGGVVGIFSTLRFLIRAGVLKW